HGCLYVACFDTPVPWCRCSGFETFVNLLSPAPCYLSDSTHVTIVLMSASGTLLGGIGIVPHTPLPPLFTFCSSFAGAELSPAYFLAISLYPGPTTFLSTA